MFRKKRQVDSFVRIIYVFISLNIVININQVMGLSKYSITKCGLNRPTIDKDCFDYSNSTNACCFYSYAGDTGCVLLNTRYKGGKQYGGLIVECFDNFIGISRLSLFIFFLIVYV